VTTAIDLQAVSVTFEDGADVVRAVDEVTLTAQPGELVVIKGASGSGKSTLLNVIAGLQPLDEGSAIVAGVDLSSADEEERALLRLEHVGVVFQDNNLIRELSAQENVELPLRARGWVGAAAGVEAVTTLELVGLDELAHRRPGKLSGGQRQRVGIARALVGGRSVLVADEPTGSLDSQNSHAVFALLQGLARRNVCVIVASHDGGIDSYADRIMHMTDGGLR
jgi:ABC-type lipoprotein export system ATPase subunit